MPGRLPQLRSIFVLVVLGLMSISIRAETLSWPECVTLAAQGNMELKSALLGWHSADQTAKSLQGSFYPQVNAVASASRGSAAGTTSTTISTPSLGGSSTVHDSYNTYLSATQNVFNGFQDVGKYRQADYQAQVQQAAYLTEKAKASYDLKVAYSTLLYAYRSVALQKEILKRREENLRLVQLRFESGGENKGSVLLSAAYLNQANYDALQARNSIPAQQSALARQFGRDSADIVVEQDVPLVDIPEHPDFQQLALQTPDYQNALAQKKAAEAGVTIARSAFSPTLNVNGLVGKTGDSWYPQNDRWSVGATLNVPLFNGGRDFHATKSANDALDAAQATLDNTSKQSVTKLQLAYNAYVEARAKLGVDESFQAAALKRAEIARSKYNNGLMTFEDWDLIESDLINRQKSVLQSQQNLTQAEAGWQQALGMGVLP